MDKLKQKLKDLPEKSGVYIMYGEGGSILYIGKARVLKNRVRQYFQSGSKTLKVMTMVNKIVDFDYIITRNEIEALVLENNLIKKHKPPYNILLKDDKSYPFIRIDLKQDFPKIEVVRKLKNDGARYFGPYMQGISAKDIFELLHSAFCLRSCNLNFSKIPKKHRPCLYYHIGRCAAPCAGYIDRAAYHAVIDDVVHFLSGNDREIQAILKQKMQIAAETEEFELALEYRHKLEILDKLVRKQVSALPKDFNLDIFAAAGNGFNTVIAVLFVRGGKLLGGDKVQVTDLSLDAASALSNYIVQYYDSHIINVDEVITADALEDAEPIAEFLRQKVGRRIHIIHPHQGVRRQLADLAASNAQDYLEKCIGVMERKQNMTLGGVSQLQEYLNLKKMPVRMECYDISNISGTDSVSSMVVCTNGEPDNKAYRRFKIKTVQGANDFASMKETLLRRLNRAREGKDSSFAMLPDLIVIDGGKGQLKFAMEALEEAGYPDIEIISLAKREEEVYLPGSHLPVILPRDSYALKLLQRLRDEAHRFAITYHRTLRGKRQTKSVLLEIEGVGESRVKELYRHFGSLAKIKQASQAELAEVKGISSPVAANIFRAFHPVSKAEAEERSGAAEQEKDASQTGETAQNTTEEGKI